ncbi:hypothetical protein ACFQXA_23365 [Nocardiopsis composta]
MSGPDPSGYAPAWLALREPADAEARSADLVAEVRGRLAGRAPGPLLVRDLGSGTGAMARWLAGRLPGPQHWVLYDRDPELLARAAAAAPPRAADGSPVGLEVREADLTALGAPDLAGAGLVTASALLDLLTAEEVAGLAAACTGAGCAALITLSVAGRVELDPADPLDAGLQAAFNAHQRRACGDRRPLDRTPPAPRPGPSGSTAPRCCSGPARGGSARPAPSCSASGCTAGSPPPSNRPRRWPPAPRATWPAGPASANPAGCTPPCTTPTCSPSRRSRPDAPAARRHRVSADR